MTESNNDQAALALPAAVLSILAVVAALYFFFPQPPAPAEHLYGRTEKAFRDEYSQLLSKAGLSTQYTRCKYYPKSLTLSCEVPPLKEAMLLVAMTEAGWKASQDKDALPIYRKAGNAMSISCPINRGEKPCEVTFQAGASTGA